MQALTNFSQTIIKYLFQFFFIFFSIPLLYFDMFRICVQKNITSFTNSVFFGSLNWNYNHKLATRSKMSVSRRSLAKKEGERMLGRKWFYWLHCHNNSYLLVVYDLFWNCPKTSWKWTGFVNTLSHRIKTDEASYVWAVFPEVCGRAIVKGEIIQT